MAALRPIKFPGPTDRLYILGRSGCGKTTAAIWHLSGWNFNDHAGFIINTKGDTTLNKIAEIPGVKNITVDDDIEENGLYHIRPDTQTKAGQIALDNFLRRLWLRGDCLILIDEGYMIEIDDALNGLLTQGRDKHIAMIVLTQRPTWITKFVESEANFVQLFGLSRLPDRINVTGLVPVDKNYKLAKYESYWYNVDDDDLRKCHPLPNTQIILNNFRAKFPPEQAQPSDIPEAKVRPMARRVI